MVAPELREAFPAVQVVRRTLSGGQRCAFDQPLLLMTDRVVMALTRLPSVLDLPFLQGQGQCLFLTSL